MAPAAITYPTNATVTSGLINTDIGVVGVSGSGIYSGGIWTVTGGGSQVATHSADSCHFLYKQVTGNCSMIAKVNSVSLTAAAAKAGVMIRASLSSSTSQRAWVAITASATFESYNHGWTQCYGGSNWETHPRNGQGPAYLPSTPYWVKLERLGNTISTYISLDGASWEAATVAVFDNLPATTYLGLFVSALNTSSACTGVFSNVSITGGDNGNLTTPPAPYAVYASPDSGQVPLRWLQSFGATSYNVLRSTNGGSSYVTVATGVTNASYIDKSVASSTTYHYAIQAVNAAGTSSNSPADSATTAATPPVPTGLLALSGNAQATLLWNASSGATNYNVKRSTTSGSGYVTVTNVPNLNAVSPGLANGTTYYFVVSAIGAAGESADSSEVAVTPVGSASAVLFWNGTVNGTWDASTANWLNAGAAAIFANGNKVVFDDSAAANTTISLSINRTPGAMVFNNVTKSYTFSGNAIVGPGSLIKQGSGGLNLNGANAYSGGTTCTGGTLTLGNATALGTGALNLTDGGLNNNATITIANVINVSGSCNVYAANGVNFSLTGPLTGSGTFMNNLANQNSSLTVSGDLNNFTGTIVYQDSDNTYNNFNLGGATSNSMNASQARISVSGGSNLARRLSLSGTPFQLGDLSGSGGTVAINGTLAVGSLNLDSTFAGMFPNTTGNLIKVGTGTLTLLGANAYTGQTIVSNGALVISTVFAGKGNFVVTNGATLGVTNLGSGSAVISNLTLAAGTTLELQNVVNASTPLVVASNLTVGGSCVVKITMPTTVSEGVYPLLNYAGKFTGTFANLSAQLSANVSNVFGGTLVSNVNQVSLMIAAVAPPLAPATLVANSGNAQATLSWATSIGASGYRVWRSLTSGSGYTLLTSTAGVNYTDVNVTNGVAYFYVVTATNSVGSSGNSPEAGVVPRLVVNWTGATNAIWDTVTTNWSANGLPTTYRDVAVAWFGDTALSNYSVTLSASAAPALVVVSNSANNYTIGGSAITGSGSLVKAGSYPLYLSGANTYTGGTTNGGGYILLSASTVGSAGNVASGPLGTGLITLTGGSLGPDNAAIRTNANAIQVATGTTSALGTPWSGNNLFLTGALSGGGTLQSDSVAPLANYTTFLLGNLSAFTGTLSYNGVTSGNGANWRVGANNSTVDLSQANVVLNGGSGKTFGFTDNALNILLKIGALSGNGYFQGCFTNAAGVGSGMVMQVGLLNTDATFSGQLGISGNNMANFSLIKLGSGTQWLTGPNIYTGQTTVSNGALVISTAFAGKGNFLVTNGATLGVTNLSAASAIVSNLVSATGTKLEFYNVSNTITPLVQASNVTVGGSCVVRITGTDNLTAGSVYPLIKYAGAFTGTFADYQLEMPYGWRGTLVNSSKQISLANVDVVATDSPTMTVTNSGSQIQFSWPATHIGWRLQVQTNSLSTGLGTNWVDAADVSSTNKVIVPTSSAVDSVFYRLVYP